MDPVSMAFAAVGWLMSALVNKAVTALLEAWAKRIGIGSEFKTLKDQLLQLGALLTSARCLPTNNSFMDELVQDFQQVAYRAENLLDELNYYRLQDEILRGTQEKVNCSNKSSVASSSSVIQLTRHSILSTLKGMSCRSPPDALVPQPETFFSIINLTKRMKEIVEQLQKSEEKVRNAVETESLVITACKTEISQTEATNIPQTSSFLTEPRLVFGRNQECDKLLNLLTNEETAIVGKVPVLAIVGSGGVGKTTLAGRVFNDPKVHSYFEVRSWICVSTQFDSVRLTREMLEAACGNRYDTLTNLEELQKKLKDKLVSKRFLLVLDDMWEDKNKNQWDLMVAPLNYCRVKGSIILVTARNQSVVEMVDAKNNIYLHGLDEKSFLSFFSTCIFNDPNFGGNWRLRKIGQEIANKLKGNPLAAKTVSALLKKRLDERYWMEIRDSEEWKSHTGASDVMSALRLSYEHMPFHLQRCFSYCAIFPEDYPFTYEELVYLWMAQGFLDVRSEGKRMEDIGRAYFDDLFNRGFFQTTQATYGDKEFYTFHDLIHDLAHMVSLKECLTINGTEPRQISPTIRHLSIFHSTERGEDAIVRALGHLDGEYLSTIINWGEFLSGTSGSILDLLKKAKFLRAATLTLCSEVRPHNFNFQNFISLRYLRLINYKVNNDLKSLLREICRLYHLEVFQIDTAWILDELPNNFSDLVSLRHFIVHQCKLHSKIRSVGKLTSLQELSDFEVQQKKGFEIEQLGSLKEIGGSLHIWNLENVKSEGEASNARLEEKEKLDLLYLQWNYGEQENKSVLEGLRPNTNLKLLEISGYGGVASPTWLDPSFIFLESLTLEDCKAWELLPPLWELEFLKHLKLSGLAVRKIGPRCYGTRQSLKFPSLEVLEIYEMSYLEKWVWSDQHQLTFPCLENIRIEDCSKLVDLPLSGCPSLKSLMIKNCPLIIQLPPLPYSSLLSFISIDRTGIIESMLYKEEDQCLFLYQSLSPKVGELLAFHELRSLRVLEISNITSLESLDLHSFLALEKLVIEGCQSLTSLSFGNHSGCLKLLKIISCKTLSSMKGLKSWVKMESLYFRECPGFIAAWDSASKEIQRTEPDFSLSLTKVNGDSLALLTMPICKQLTSLQIFELEVSAFTEEHEVSPQLVTSIHLVDTKGYKNLQSFPFYLFPSLKKLMIRFPRIQSLPKNWLTEIREECLKLGNIGKVYTITPPVQILLLLTSEEMTCDDVSQIDWRMWRDQMYND